MADHADPRRTAAPPLTLRVRSWGVALLALALLLLPFAPTPLAGQQPASGTVLGQVIDQTTGETLPTVQVAVRARGDSTAVAGSLTDRSGRFLFPALPAGEYELTFTRVGYAPVVEPATVTGEADAGVDVGTIAMTPAAVELAEVNVIADRPAVVYAPDRDIYDAAQVAGAAGGSATDVLDGIPDLEVDINGQITMFGQSPAIYINGREAPMTGESLALFLEQFAAGNIESVEVMPNPSSRYDAEGAGGIVNIVLREDVSLGISGNAFVNGGTRGQFGGGGRATFQRGPLTLNGGTSLRLSSDDRTTSQLRQNLLVDPITFLQQDGQINTSRWAGNLDLRAGYELGENTELEAEGRFSRNVSEAERITRYIERDAEENVLDEYDLLTYDDGSGNSIDLALELEHEFAGDEGDEAAGPPRGGPPGGFGRGGRGGPGGSFGSGADELSIEIEFERGGDGEDSLVERRLLEDLGVIDYATELTWEEDRETESELAVGFDFVRGIMADLDLEVGYEGEFGWTDRARIEQIQIGGDPTIVEDRGFTHRQTVHGGYLTLMRTFGDFGAQLGARAEYADNRLELPGFDERFGRTYFDVFPNANVNYTIDDSKRLRFSYSMRIRRPSSNVLNPIDTSSDPLNRQVGNPDIDPQYTHNYMLNASWSGGIGFLRVNPFLRRSVNEWEELRTVDENGVATTTYDNLGSTNAYGVSVTGSLRDLWGVRGQVSLNAQHTDRNYSAVIDRPTPSSTRWSLRTNLDREFGSSFSAQAGIVYNPPRDLPQGRASSTLMTRLGMRYRFLDRRASLNLNVTDPFDIYDQSIQRSSSSYIETGLERVSMRRLTMSLSYSFQAGGGARGGRGGGPGGFRGGPR